MKTSQRRRQKRTRPSSTSRRRARLRPRTSSRPQPSRPPLSRAQPKLTAPLEPRGALLVGVYNTVRTRDPQTKNLGLGPLGPPQALGCYSQSTSTPAPALVTKATSKVPLSPKAPWDTPLHPSRAPNTPTRRTVTEAPSYSWTSREVSSSSPHTHGSSQGVASSSWLDFPPWLTSFQLHKPPSQPSLNFNLFPPWLLSLFPPPTAFNGIRTWRQANIGTKKNQTRSSASFGWWTIFKMTENNVRKMWRHHTHKDLEPWHLQTQCSSQGRIAAVFIYVHYIAPFSIWFFSLTYLLEFSSLPW